MLEPVLTAPIFAVHGLLDGARGKGLATPEWLVGVLGRAGISESLLELEESRVTALSRPDPPARAVRSRRLAPRCAGARRRPGPHRCPI